jgi:hypothetical protein
MPGDGLNVGKNRAQAAANVVDVAEPGDQFKFDVSKQLLLTPAPPLELTRSTYLPHILVE